MSLYLFVLDFCVSFCFSVGWEGFLFWGAGGLVGWWAGGLVGWAGGLVGWWAGWCGVVG